MTWRRTDRKIYALRDVTATAESLPLIAEGSVMSKEARRSARAWSSTSRWAAALSSSQAESRQLARTMVELGNAYGVPTHWLTDMNRPLGRTVGNAASRWPNQLDVLAGGGPSDVVELTLALAAEMLDAAGIGDVDPADTLRDGSAMDRFRALVAAQGGDTDRPLPLGAATGTVTASRRDHGRHRRHGRGAGGLAAGRRPRANPASPCSRARASQIHRRPGEPVTAGRAVFTLCRHSGSAARRGSPNSATRGPWANAPQIGR